MRIGSTTTSRCFSYSLTFINIFFYFFFSSRRRHTRLQGDWSSDVCSSDLPRDLRIDVLWHSSPSLGIYSGIAEILIALLCEGERPLTRGGACGCRASGAAMAACLFFAAPHHVRRGFFT